MIDYILSNMWMAWLALAVVFIIVEVASFDFFVTCFAVGALGGMLAAIVGIPIWGQLLVWAVVSMLSLWLVRPALVRRLHRGGENRVSNADALIGRKGEVVEAIAEGSHGYVKIDGDEWRSVAADGKAIAKGARVEVVGRDSIVLTVKQV